MSRSTRLKLYTAYVNYGHLMWPGEQEYRAGLPDSRVDRMAFPVVATSKRHAERLAEKAWGDPRRGRVQVRYIGPCQEPEALR